MKKSILVIFSVVAFVFASCKKDKLTINEEKEFRSEVKSIEDAELGANWWLKLQPNGVADILPAGDIVYRGTYEVNGKSLKVMTNDIGEFQFKIISESEIKDKKYGVVLRLKP